MNALLALTVPYALISSFSTPFELAHSLRTSGATYLFVDPHLLPNALAAAKEVGLPESSIVILEGHVDGRRSFDSILESGRKHKLPRLAVRPATKKTLAYLVFSSGTTGLPKGISSRFHILPHLTECSIASCYDLARQHLGSATGTSDCQGRRGRLLQGNAQVQHGINCSLTL